MYADLLVKALAEDDRPQAPSMKNQPAFFRNLEKVLDTRRQTHSLIGLKPRWDSSVSDFTTCDSLSLSRSGRVREAFLAELAKHPDFDLSASGSRPMYGNYEYINQVEQEIADFHGAEGAYITHSGFAANVSVLSGVPQPGDAIVYDELVHASSHEGFHLSLAEYKLPFRHNDAESLRDVLMTLKDKKSEFLSGTRSVLICVESVYSMDGDICNLQECINVAKEEFPLGNAQFVIDEAHSIGTIGDRGRGLVSELGLEKDIAIRVHVAGKALGSVGGIVLCNKTIRYMMLNFARSVTFSSAPSFAVVASIRAGYQLLITGQTKEAQDRVQRNVKHFFTKLTSSPVWDQANEEGLLSIPLLDSDWEQTQFYSHIVPLLTRPGHELFLFWQLTLNNMNAYPMQFPIVPKGKSRMRLMFHAHNTLQQIDKLVSTILDWATEMLDIEQGAGKHTLPEAARQIYSMQIFNEQ
ncbi:8-amino-7-oxononanoate synthase [Xylaria telfairii]|nr:8-amino-7-oxononanoate synthase [Xylaria telfairii]